MTEREDEKPAADGHRWLELAGGGGLLARDGVPTMELQPLTRKRGLRPVRLLVEAVVCT
ncbi:MAG: hypothetical protein Q8L14_34525 [Myxococcales bacterium]|nr:hypothetical protein [Myxococcales bacterium]